jgi:hypothetical protein
LCPFSYTILFRKSSFILTPLLLILLLLVHIFFIFSCPCSVSYTLRSLSSSSFPLLLLQAFLDEGDVSLMCNSEVKNVNCNSNQQTCEAKSTGNGIDIVTCHPFRVSQTPVTSKWTFSDSCLFLVPTVTVDWLACFFTFFVFGRFMAWFCMSGTECCGEWLALLFLILVVAGSIVPGTGYRVWSFPWLAVGLPR